MQFAIVDPAPPLRTWLSAEAAFLLHEAPARAGAIASLRTQTMEPGSVGLKTVALAWRRDGAETEWNPTFAGMAFDLGLGIEVCWPYSPRQNLNDIATHPLLSVTVLVCGGPHPSIQCACHPLRARFSTSTSPGPLTAAKSSPARKVK